MKYLLSLLLCAHVVFGMEEATHATVPRVVNYMAGDQLPEDLTSAVIFGATPRISRFSEFVRLVVDDVQGICNAPNQRTSKKLRKLKRRLDDLAKHFTEDPRSDIALKCFFPHGFREDHLRKNMHVLVTESQQCSDRQNLIHVLLPSYFEVEDFKDIPIEQRGPLLERFLGASAQFYKRLYAERQPEKPVYIVVPPLEEFVDKIGSQDKHRDGIDVQRNDNQIIAHILEKYIFKKGVSRATLLNQNGQESEDIHGELQKKGLSREDITSQELKLLNDENQSINIFNSYTVPTHISEPIPFYQALVEIFNQATQP